MEKLKTICERLNRMHIKYERSEDNQKIQILACEVGDNFYDYSETPKRVTFYPHLEFLKNDPRVQIIECDGCCGCAGW